MRGVDYEPGYLVYHPSDVLRAICVPIDKIDGFVLALSNVLTSNMLTAKGIGLAAPQIGLPVRMIVVANPGEKGIETLTMVNPEIVYAAETTSVTNEGCLSIPGFRLPVRRPIRITARYLDLEGITREIEAESMLAKCIQHEIDHLDGKLIFDHVSEDEREAFLKAYTESRRASLVPEEAL
jgi:peptide deformylase